MPKRSGPGNERIFRPPRAIRSERRRSCYRPHFTQPQCFCFSLVSMIQQSRRCSPLSRVKEIYPATSPIALCTNDVMKLQTRQVTQTNKVQSVRVTREMRHNIRFNLFGFKRRRPCSWLYSKERTRTMQNWAARTVFIESVGGWNWRAKVTTFLNKWGAVIGQWKWPRAWSEHR